MVSCNPEDGITQWDAELERYLLDKVERGDRFFKSRFIAAELDVSAKRVGSSLTRLTNESSQLEIDTWGGTSDGTTWQIKKKV